MRRPLYIETLIQADLGAIWQITQGPGAHQRWDLRFTTIEPSPLSGETDPTRRFRYATRVLPWLMVSGHGTCAGERERPDGSRISALRFSSAHPLSLIADGAGYWRYLPAPDGVRFLTGYDYAPRWGAAGRAADLVFRPLMGWATAWSFDRLRLWLEHGITPERALRRALGDAGWRAAVALGALLTLPTPVAVLVAGVSALTPPLPRTPAARRCRRRPPDRLGATPPSRLAHLEQP